MWAWVLSGPCHLGHMVPSRVAGVGVGGRDLNWERNPLAECRPGVRCQGCEPKTRELQVGFMWAWVLSGPELTHSLSEDLSPGLDDECFCYFEKWFSTLHGGSI